MMSLSAGVIEYLGNTLLKIPSTPPLHHSILMIKIEDNETPSKFDYV
jgi:hypothetical protein